MTGISTDLKPNSNMIKIKAEDFDQKTGDSEPARFRLDQSDEQPDIVFVCGEDLTPIKAHRVVLKDCSKFLAKAFACTAEIRSFLPVIPFIVLKELSATDVRDILQFIYNGTIMIEKSRLASFIKAARFLEIKNLSDLAVEDLLDSSEVLPQNENQNGDLDNDMSVEHTVNSIHNKPLERSEFNGDDVNMESRSDADQQEFNNIPRLPTPENLSSGEPSFENSPLRTQPTESEPQSQTTITSSSQADNQQPSIETLLGRLKNTDNFRTIRFTENRDSAKKENGVTSDQRNGKMVGYIDLVDDEQEPM